MRTRNSGSSRTPPAKKTSPAKKTPPTRNSTSKSPANAQSSQAKRTSTIRTRQAKKNEALPLQYSSFDEEPVQPSEEAKATADASPMMAETKVVAAAKSTPQRTPKRAVGRPRKLNKAVAAQEQEEQVEAITDGSPKADNIEVAKKLEEPLNVEEVKADEIESKQVGEHGFECVRQCAESELHLKEGDECNADGASELAEKKRDIAEAASLSVSVLLNQEEPAMVELSKFMENEERTGAKEGEQANEEEWEKESEKSMKGRTCNIGHEEQFNADSVSMEIKKNGKKNEEPTGAKEGEQTDEEEREKESEKSMKGQTTNIGHKEQCNADSVSMSMEMKDQREQVMEVEGEKQSEKSLEEQTTNIGHKGQCNADSVSVSMGMKDQRQQVMELDGEKESDKSMEKEGGKALEKSMQEETSNVIHNQESNTASVEKEMTNEFLQDDVKPKNENPSGDQGAESCGERLDREEQGMKEFVEADPQEPLEEAETLDEECKELSTMAKERKIKKENEIFVGGLDRDATEEDLEKVFEKIGEIVEVRLHKNSSTNKNKGYAFVKFSCKEHAKKALSEMKNPVICGKRCGTAPSEDNDTLFLGNICNTWTKEAIKQKLKDYGVEGVENVTLVPDVHHEGLSRGFAFLEFSCHHDAMLAYKRLQKPDVIFGHTERTVKVAFAEPVRDLDPEIMAQVKSVFVDGLPPHWDEGCIGEHFKGYGEIIRIVLSRNMTSAKRKDFGFVDFSTHEAAVACVDGVNSSEFVDGTQKTKVRARLSNPLPKTQAVKGGMCGGFRIGHARGGAFPGSGRGFNRGVHAASWGNFNRDRNFNHGRRNFNHGGHGQIGRMGFRNDLNINNAYPDFHQRQLGERMIPLRGGHHAGAPSRPHLDRAWYGAPGRGPGEPIPPRPWYGAPERGPGEPMAPRPWYGAPDSGRGAPIPPRMPFAPEGQFDGPFMGRHVDDPYLREDSVHGMKRPFYMTDQDPNYMGPVRHRPRLDYTDPTVFPGSHNHAGRGQYSRDYHGADYGGGPYSSFNGGDNSYGRRYYN